MAASIGQFKFLTMDPPPSVSQEVITPEMRPGQDGADYWREGDQYVPTRHVTTVDLPSQQYAQSLYRQYLATKTRLQQVGWGATVYPELFQVLRVEILDIRQGVSAVGGINGGTVLLICEWTLHAQANSVVQEAT